MRLLAPSFVLVVSCAPTPAAQPAPSTTTAGSQAVEPTPQAAAAPPAASNDPAQPPASVVVIEHTNPPGVQRVSFGAGARQLDPSADATLDAVAEVLRDHPEVRRIWITGHSDPQLSGEGAEALSQSRAEVVRDALLRRGVDPARLSPVGLASDCPLAPPGTPQNDRVEFKIAEHDGEQRPVGC